MGETMDLHLNKKRIAKEWLYFVGITLLYWVVVLVVYGSFGLEDSTPALVVLALFLPYWVFLFLRSIVWAVRTVVKGLRREAHPTNKE